MLQLLPCSTKHCELLMASRTLAKGLALAQDSPHIIPIKQCKADSQCASLQDVLNEVERNLHDAMGVARNVALDPRLVPGGGAVEMAVARGLNDKASTVGRKITENMAIS